MNDEDQKVQANIKLQRTREKFLEMGLTQEEVDLIVAPDRAVAK
tara:strand:- start:1350 stop:1481 length:132 start_codon:yes stop_codon:yes gene_type:complete